MRHRKPRNESASPDADDRHVDPSIENTSNDEDSQRNSLLLNLDRLLNAAQELMRNEPTLGKAAFEHLRQLRVKVRYAISATTPDRPNALPSRAPALWDARVDREISPLTFLVNTYKIWLDAGNISRADIRRLDKHLYLSLYRAGITGKQLDEIGLPTKSSLIDRKLAKAGKVKAPSRTMLLGELPAEERDKFRLYQASRARQRKQD